MLYVGPVGALTAKDHDCVLPIILTNSAKDYLQLEARSLRFATEQPLVKFPFSVEKYFNVQ